MLTLLAEDDPILGRALEILLNRCGMSVDWVRDGIDAYSASQKGGYSLFIFDLGLPGLDGGDLLRRVRQIDGKTPVLIITARADPRDRIRCLDLGADDCLTKPFDVEELMARLRAIARRSGTSPGARLRVGSIEIDLLQRTASRNGFPVGLTGQEFVVLHLLMSAADQAVSRRAIAEHLGVQCELPAGNLVEVYIHRLRRKLGRDFIRTYRGGGYSVTL